MHTVKGLPALQENAKTQLLPKTTETGKMRVAKLRVGILRVKVQASM